MLNFDPERNIKKNDPKNEATEGTSLAIED